MRFSRELYVSQRFGFPVTATDSENYQQLSGSMVVLEQSCHTVS
jgi:hypothetical protein